MAVVFYQGSGLQLFGTLLDLDSLRRASLYQGRAPANPGPPVHRVTDADPACRPECVVFGGVQRRLP